MPRPLTTSALSRTPCAAGRAAPYRPKPHTLAERPLGPFGDDRVPGRDRPGTQALPGPPAR
ncbi:hypothetical protein AB0J25_11355, partial [Streptomyces sp. NPDC049910]|uniref:hypothetical protein n=1 Tax=Streptomyces sp. NPDC049910 TaxID=3155278 RepID=UPI00341F7F7F